MRGLRWNTNEFPLEALAARTHGDQGVCRLRVRTTFSTDHLSHGVPERKEQRKGDECTAFSTCLPQILMCISNAFGRLCLCCHPAFLFCFYPSFILLLLSSLPFSHVLLSFLSSSFFLVLSFIFLLCFLYQFLRYSFNFSCFPLFLRFVVIN